MISAGPFEKAFLLHLICSQTSIKVIYIYILFAPLSAMEGKLLPMSEMEKLGSSKLEKIGGSGGKRM